jgi:hypothetical protein
VPSTLLPSEHLFDDFDHADVLDSTRASIERADTALAARYGDLRRIGIKSAIALAMPFSTSRANELFGVMARLVTIAPLEFALERSTAYVGQCPAFPFAVHRHSSCYAHTRNS